MENLKNKVWQAPIVNVNSEEVIHKIKKHIFGKNVENVLRYIFNSVKQKNFSIASCTIIKPSDIGFTNKDEELLFSVFIERLNSYPKYMPCTGDVVSFLLMDIPNITVDKDLLGVSVAMKPVHLKDIFVWDQVLKFSAEAINEPVMLDSYSCSSRQGIAIDSDWLVLERPSL